MRKESQLRERKLRMTGHHAPAVAATATSSPTTSPADPCKQGVVLGLGKGRRAVTTQWVAIEDVAHLFALREHCIICVELWTYFHVRLIALLHTHVVELMCPAQMIVCRCCWQWTSNSAGTFHGGGHASTWPPFGINSNKYLSKHDYCQRRECN